jgi:NH2-acetyltransferase
MNSSRVISAWDGDRLVGLIRVMDDSKNAPFYEKQGFKVKERIN